MIKVSLFAVLVFNLMTANAQRVGIGTNQPTAPLTVISDVSSKGIIQKDGDMEIGFFTDISSGSAYIQTWSNHPLRFGTNNSSAQMTLATNGNVGIGVGITTPSDKLVVSGVTSTSGLKVGSTSASTVIGDIILGQHVVGASATTQKTTTLTFPQALGSVPRIFATVRHDPSFNVNDAFSVTVKSISTTQAVFIVRRLDNDLPWGQNLRIDYMIVR